ncbi:MAG: hypothetical protein EBS19_15635, partial [Spirochaetia bacterium]|nr:hypothetical protein [Spirochaetia bacterium]
KKTNKDITAHKDCFFTSIYGSLKSLNDVTVEAENNIASPINCNINIVYSAGKSIRFDPIEKKDPSVRFFDFIEFLKLKV